MGRQLAALLSLFAVGLPTAAAAQTVTHGEATAAPGVMERRPASHGDGHEAGLKTRAIVKAVKLLASGIRKGDRYANKVIGQLDDASRAAYRAHAHTIANKLDKLAELPDLAVNIVKDQIITLLNVELGVQYRVAYDVAEVISIVISAML